MSYTKTEFLKHQRATLDALRTAIKLVENHPGGLADRDNMVCELNEIAAQVKANCIDKDDPDYAGDE
jgi:hypothetical protein